VAVRFAAEHIDLILPNSANDFSRMRISVDMYRRTALRVTVTGSCGIFRRGSSARAR
jgi:hypothetical protein